MASLAAKRPPMPHHEHDRRPQRRCPVCTFSHTGDTPLCEVCTATLTPEEQARYAPAPVVQTAPPVVVSPVETPAPPVTAPVMEPAAPARATPDARATNEPASLPPPEASVPDVTAPPTPPAALAVPDDTAVPVESPAPVVAASPPRPGSAGRPRLTCPVCAHPFRAGIEQVLIDDSMTGHQIAARYEVSRHQVTRHRLECMGMAPQSKAEAAKKGGGTRPRLPQCKVCTHPKRAQIDAALRARVPIAQVERELRSDAQPCSDRTLGKHLERCLGLPRVGRGGGRGPIASQVKGSRAATEAQAVPQATGTPAAPRVPQEGTSLCPAGKAVVGPVVMPAQSDCPFPDHVAGELARLAARQEALAAMLFAIAAEQEALDHQYTALRTWQVAAGHVREEQNERVESATQGTAAQTNSSEAAATQEVHHG